ncbi:hypothetical protein D922_01236 [Enterococcus faecalis 06-MB-DW-09]|nr:hypothetical protein D922_01236 [Enterococcus faecalis 06-MB-DW-09]
MRKCTLEEEELMLKEEKSRLAQTSLKNAPKTLQTRAALLVAREILEFAKEQEYDDDVLIQACKVIAVAPT